MAEVTLSGSRVPGYIRLRAVIIQTLLFCCVVQQSLFSDYQDIVSLITLLVIRSSTALHK